MKYTSDTISSKVFRLSFLATLSVVLIHSNTLEGRYEPSWAVWVGNWIGYLQHWAVPYFFVVAGFFFDRGYASAERKTIDFWKSKVSSLLVPYLIWGCLWGGLILTPIKCYVNLKAGIDCWQGTPLETMSFFPIADRLLGITVTAPPNGALWFVRELILFFLIAPVWRWIRKRGPFVIPLACVLLLCWSFPMMNGFGVEHILGVNFKAMGFGYLLLGMSISLFRLENLKCPMWMACLCLAFWAGTAHHAIYVQEIVGVNLSSPIWLFLFKMSPIPLLVFIWTVFEYVPFPVSARVASLAFWIYCMHHPVTSIMGAIGHMVLGRSLTGEALRMVLVFGGTAVVCIVFGYALKIRCNRLYAVLIGGRTER